MQKIKRSKFFLVAVLIISLLAVYGNVPVAKAANFDSVKDTLSDSEPGVTALHTFTIDLGHYGQLSATDVLRVDFKTGFSGISAAEVTCPNGGTASTTGLIVDCTGVIVASNTPQTLTATATNPTVGSYKIDFLTRDNTKVEIESDQVSVYIIEPISVTAHVDSTLTFSVQGTTTGAVINGITTTEDTTATTTPFGTIDSSASSTVGQGLSVITNAEGGFSVTVQQDGELQTAAGATINNYNNSPDNTGSSTDFTLWTAPTGVLTKDHTWGHLGVTSDDSDLSYNGSLYAGMNGIEALEVFSHNGPADGSTQDAGRASVAYTVGITDLQESGDYTAQFTYICTATY